jgi:hypothetical protein
MGTSLQGKALFAKGSAVMQVSMLVGIGAAALFGVAEIASWRRNNRRDVDNVGFMPWSGIALASAAVALFATAFWLSGR